MADDARTGGGAKAWIGGAFRLAMFPVVFLWPAGDWLWWEAWALVGLYLAYAGGVGVFLFRNDRDLLRERMKVSPAQEGQKGWDKTLMILMMVAGFGIFIVPGFDVVRFGWTGALPTWLEVTALVVNVPCFFWIGWVMHENTYLARVVKIDEERGHTVITTGPYAIVRHPMYTAVVLMIMAMPVALGSRWGLVPAAVMAALLLVRTALEDRTLHRELPGYPEYAQKTPYRLIPGIW